MSKPFQLAFLGLDNPHGAGWRQSLLNFGDEIKITAIVPGFDGATASLEERHTDAPRFDNVDDLIAGGNFDGAIVCLPNDSGPEAMVKLAEAGKHILAEKPVAGTAEDARRIADAVKQNGVAFQTGYMWRYDDGADRVREMVKDGRFGRMISIEMLYTTSDVQRRNPEHYLFDRGISKGGFFNWLACHYFDLLFYITGASVVGVTSRVGVFGDTPVDVEDGGAVILDLAGGAIATFIGGYWHPRWAGENHWCFRGSERWVHWNQAKKGTSGELEIHGPQPQWSPMDEIYTLPADETPGYGGTRCVRSIRDWMQAAEQGGRPCRSTPDTMVATLELIDTIYQASQEGRRIECCIGP